MPQKSNSSLETQWSFFSIESFSMVSFFEVFVVVFKTLGVDELGLDTFGFAVFLDFDFAAVFTFGLGTVDGTPGKIFLASSL